LSFPFPSNSITAMMIVWQLGGNKELLCAAPCTTAVAESSSNHCQLLWARSEA